MSKESNASERLSDVIAVLIAVISIVGAMIAWWVAGDSSNAGSADTSGLLASVDSQDALTEAYNTLYGHLTAYSRAMRDDALARTLYSVENATTDANLRQQLALQVDALTFGANALRGLIPQQYLDRNKHLDQQRDVGETLADRELQHDTFPDPHFATADLNRVRSQWLLGILVILGVAFVLLTLADAIKNPVRYFLLLIAILIFLGGAAGATFIQFVGVPTLHIRLF